MASSSCRQCISFLSTSVLAFYTLLINLSQASLNIEEINSLSYRIDILEKPVLSDQAQTGSVMQIVSKYGQEYRCNIPEIPVPKVDTKLHEDPASPLYRPLHSDIAILLKPLETGPCLVKTKDWWTYEFCYGKHIKQYHLEDNKIVSPVIVLGAYHSEYDWKNKSKEDETSRNRLQRYHSQYYVNGSKCEVTGILRRAEVRFLCEDGAGDYISQVDEPESCRYIITVRTTRVCHHPYLRPPPTNTPRLITCNPILTSAQYEAFQKQEEEDKKLIEEKRKAWLTKQEEQFVELNRNKEEREDEKREDEGRIFEDREKVDANKDPMDGMLDPFNVQFESDGDGFTVADESEKDKDEESLVLTFEKLAERLQLLGKVLEEKMENEELETENTEESGRNAKDETFGKLVTTLTQLLKQMDKAEQDLNNANEALWNLQNAILNQDQSKKKIPTEDSKEDRSEEVVTQKMRLQMEPATSEEDKNDEELAHPRNSLKLKVKKITPEMLKVLKLKSDDAAEVDQSDEKTPREMTAVENAFRDHLKQSGMGNKVEVKIITSGYLDEDGEEFHFLNEDESNQLQTVLIKLLAGNEEMAEQAQRQKMLEKNYKFQWKDRSQKSFIEDFDEEDEEV